VGYDRLKGGEEYGVTIADTLRHFLPLAPATTLLLYAIEITLRFIATLDYVIVTDIIAATCRLGLPARS